MATLAIYLFGAPRAELDGQPIVTDTRKATALLAYLAVTRQPQTRDALATLLWPELDQKRARAALRRTLSVLNAGQELPWLVIEREQVQLVWDDELWCDIAEFEACTADCLPLADEAACGRCRPVLERAANLYADDFLAGFTLRDSAAFDDWQFFQAESYRNMLAGVLEALIRCTTRGHEWAAATLHARRRLALDPMHEPAHRQLMQLYAWNNQRAAALRQYQECERILAEELGVPPLDETTALYTAILNHEVPAPPSVPEVQPLPVFTPPTAPLPTLVGREHEWTALTTVFRAAGERGRLVVIVGEAGVGKTAIATAFAEAQARDGASVLSVVCYEGEATLAYAPLATLLQNAVANPVRRARLAGLDAAWLAEVARLQPTLLGPHITVAAERSPDPFAAQSRFFEGLAHAIYALLDGDRPGLLLLDDVHFADSATLDWLTYLVRRLALHRVSIVLVWRSDDVPASHRLRQLAGDSARQGAATVIELERLPASAVATWIEQAVTDPAVDRAQLAKRLFAETEGLPFFVAEYLNLLAGDRLSWSESSWAAPDRVVEFLRARLAPLPEVAQQVLAAAAVIGRAFDLATVVAASGRSEEETITALEELLARRLILEGAAERLDFSHAQLRQVVYAELSQLRRRLLHRRVGDALAAQARRSGAEENVAGAIAQHYQLGGESQKAAHFAFVAGEQAYHVYANREAIAYFEQALALDTPERCAAYTHLGDLHTLLGEYGRAEQAYTAALAQCSADRQADLEHRLGRLYARLGDANAAGHHFAAAYELLPPDATVGRAQLLIDWALTVAHTQNMVAATDLAQQGLAAAEQAGDATALSRAHTLLALLARRSGNLDAALTAAQAGLAAARNQPDSGVLVSALNSLALVHADGGDPTAGIPLIEEALDQVLRIGDRHREAALRNTLADLHHACGETERAMTQLKQAVVIFAEIGSAVGGENAEIWMLREW